MTSTFSVFRRNQTLGMAILVGVAILSFIVAPALTFVMQGSQRAMARGGKATIVRWRGGAIDEGGFERLNRVNYRCQAVLNQVLRDVLKAGGKPNVPNFTFDQRTGTERLAFYDPGVPTIERRFLFEKAKEAGVYLEDQAIDAYLLNLTDGKISRKRFDQLMRESENLSKFELYEFLREELTASLFEKTAVAGINSGNATLITPNRYWQLFLQFNQRARIEAFPVMVDDLLAEVKNEPSEAELNSVYQQGSGLPSFKGSARPGFMRRYQGNVEFVSASIDKFLEPEKAKITPEQIQKAYDERVKEGRYQVPVTSESGTGVQAPDAGSPPSPGATEGTESARPPAVENPGAPNPQNSQSSSKVPSSVKLVSFEQAGDAANPVSIQTPATNATSPASSNSAEVTTLPGTGTATQEPATVPTTSAADINAGLPTANPTQPAKPMRTQTLDEVKDALIRELAFPEANKVMRGAFEKVGNAMQTYFEELNIYNQSLSVPGSTIAKPAMIDLQKLADENGLTFGTTGLVDSESVQALPIGKSRVMFQYPFGDVVLNPRLPLYQQGNSMDLDIMSNSRTEYLFWKVEDKAAYLPPLSDIKDEVKAAWKRLEAQKLADKKAQEIARRVEQLKESPWDALEQAERGLVVNPPAFSAMMPSFGRGEPQMSPVDQIDSAGASFVTKVFSMTPGQVSVAANQPQSIYYVIRLVEKLPNETELRTMFERMPVQPDTRNLGFREIQPIFSDWVESIEKDLQVEWMVPKGSLMMQD